MDAAEMAEVLDRAQTSLGVEEISPESLNAWLNNKGGSRTDTWKENVYRLRNGRYVKTGQIRTRTRTESYSASARKDRAAEKISALNDRDKMRSYVSRGSMGDLKSMTPSDSSVAREKGNMEYNLSMNMLRQARDRNDVAALTNLKSEISGIRDESEVSGLIDETINRITAREIARASRATRGG